MKLRPKSRFSLFICPSLQMELGPGWVVSVDDYSLVVVEAAQPNHYYRVGAGSVWAMEHTFEVKRLGGFMHW